MTLKRRVNKLESQSSIRPTYADVMRRLDEEHTALIQKLDAMSEQDHVSFAFDPQGELEERETALLRLRRKHIEVERAEVALGEIRELRGKTSGLYISQGVRRK